MPALIEHAPAPERGLARREPLCQRCEIEIETSGLSVAEVVAAIEQRLAG
jgi:hypothetical protein